MNGRSRSEAEEIESALAALPQPVATSLTAWRFTRREREAAMLMVRGLRTPEICEAMNIAPNTLKTHVARILEKSGSRSRADFLAKLIRAR